MFKLKKRILTLMLSCMFVVSMAISAFAEEENVRQDGYSKLYGLEITTTTDSDTYAAGEAVTYTFKVTNTTDKDLAEICFDYTFPSMIQYDKLKINQVANIARLNAGESTEFSFTTNGTPHVADDGKNEEGSVMTIVFIIIGVVAVVVVLAVVVIILKKKKKTAATMLVGILLGGSLTGLFATPTYALTNADFSAPGVHDPSIVKDEKTGTYYIFGSHMSWAKSNDLMKWSKFTTNINSQFSTLFGDVWKNYVYSWDKSNPDEKEPQLNGNLWAPDVIWNETMQKYCMYMSVNGNRWHSAIVLLTADEIEGPYEYVDEVVFSGYDGSTEGETEIMRGKADKTVTYDGQEAKMSVMVTFQEYSEVKDRADYADIKKVLGLADNESVPARYSQDPVAGGSKVNCIDPAVEYDEDGNLWMVYGSWSAGIYQLKLDNETGLRDYDYNEYGEFVKDVSDPYLGYKIAGGYYNSGEGPYIMKAGEYYYLFLSLGNLETSGGYNMRLFRSKDINGPYVDAAGNSAIYKSYTPSAGIVDIRTNRKAEKYNSPNGIRLMSSVRMYGKSTTHVEAAQGHNSAFVDDDGKIYVIYHTRYSDTGEAFSAHVHQMFINEDGWLVVAPYEYSGETLSTTPYAATEIAGTYDLSIQYREKVFVANSSTDQKNGIYDAVSITLTADGKITGGATGTWKLTKGNNVEMVIDGKTYKGVFLKQANELATRDETLVFTVCGNNQMAWGAKVPKK